MIIVGPVAIAPNNVIGKKNDLPWYLPEDLKRFKKITAGHAVLMGRKTYESIVKRLGKPLPDRENIVITRQVDYEGLEGVKVFHSFESAVAGRTDDIYCIGGVSIFKSALEVGEKMYVTKIKQEYDGDVFFPDIDWNNWVLIDSEEFPTHTFLIYNRKDA